MYRVWNFITGYSVLLIVGALIALVWANVDAHSYHAFVDFKIADNFFIGHAHVDDHGHVHRTLTLHYLFNDLFMAFFFAIAAKEVWEAVILKNGSLRGKKAATPLFATFGGMVGPILVYLGLAAVLGSDTYDAVKDGWAVPVATDIAFAYLVGRIVFGAGHPAIRFLLLLAIADDAAGLIILAIAYPTGELAPEWLLLSIGAALLVFFLANWLPRRLDAGNELRKNSTWVRQKLGFWPYLIAGCLSWYGFMRAGIHPALGLLPIVPTIPHADRAFGIFAAAEEHLHDLLNDIEHKLKVPVEIILFFFGLLNAGVEFNAIGSPTWLVLAGLIIGKPLGVLIMGALAAHVFKLGLPAGMRTVDLIVIGFVSAIGFTVSLFIAAVAFDSSAMLNGTSVQDAAKMGALLSFGAAILAIIAGKLFRVEKQSH
jgi:NhaA family Na+:H+ antiporter